MFLLLCCHSCLADRCMCWRCCSDGPYEGAKCSSTTHSHHQGEEDSVWTQCTATLCCQQWHTIEPSDALLLLDQTRRTCSSTSGARYVEQQLWLFFGKSLTLLLFQERGMYIHAPDPFYMRGINKDGMGYVETNWNLPLCESRPCRLC